MRSAVAAFALILVGLSVQAQSAECGGYPGVKWGASLATGIELIQELRRIFVLFCRQIYQPALPVRQSCAGERSARFQPITQRQPST